MARWSQAEVDRKVAERQAAVLGERLEMFKRFRAAGWEANIQISKPFGFGKIVHDRYLGPDEYHFLVKMPGATAVILRSVARLQAMVEGVD